MRLMMQNNYQAEKEEVPSHRSNWRMWLGAWELYIIIAVSSLLRLIFLDSTEFDMDQADQYTLAHDAIRHGHLLATSTTSSLGMFNPPAPMYLLAIPAAVSSNPLWGAAWLALLSIVAVVVTYIFTRHYYGRLAGTIAALLYATAIFPIRYARFIWNPNWLLFFVPLLMATLFWGVVERRRGWVAPAIILLGILFQLHGSGALLAAPLLAAFFLAPWRTIRWYDFVLGGLGLLILYAPYLLWLVFSHYRDLSIMFFGTSSGKAVIDNRSWYWYKVLISPYEFTNTRSILYPYINLVDWLKWAMKVLVCAGALWAFILVLFGESPAVARDGMRRRSLLGDLWGSGVRWWTGLRASPMRSGLVLLLLWQVIPVVGLIHHSIDLYLHYFLILLPGEFILIGFFLARVVTWCSQRGRLGRAASVAVPILAAVIIVTQFVNAGAYLLDEHLGHMSDAWSDTHGFYYNQLRDIQGATAQADQWAQQHHYTHVYILSDQYLLLDFRYLAQQMHTPTTVSGDTTLILPGESSGPAMVLVPPYDDTATALVTHFAHARLVASPARTAGAPFQLYVVDPVPPSSTPAVTLSQRIQFQDTQPWTFHDTTYTVSRWRFTQSAQLQYQTIYTYQMLYVDRNHPDHIQLDQRNAFNSVRAGDQLLTLAQLSGPVSVKVITFETKQRVLHPHLGPLSVSFDTFSYYDTPVQVLQRQDGESLVPLS